MTAQGPAGRLARALVATDIYHPLEGFYAEADMLAEAILAADPDLAADIATGSAVRALGARCRVLGLAWTLTAETDPAGPNGGVVAYAWRPGVQHGDSLGDTVPGAVAALLERLPEVAG